MSKFSCDRPVPGRPPVPHVVLLVDGVAGRVAGLSGGDRLDVEAVARDLEVGQRRVGDQTVKLAVEFHRPAHAGLGFVVDRLLPEVLPLCVHRHRSRHGDKLCVTLGIYCSNTQTSTYYSLLAYW